MAQQPDHHGTSIPRRAALGVGLAGAAVALVACGDEPQDGPARPGSATSTAGATSTPPAGTTEPVEPDGSGAALVALADVPVGGAVVVTAADGAKVVVAQPAAGQAVAFSAECTHKQCVVRPTGKTLTCFCHNSSFDASTGTRLGGPARQPLPAVPVTVQDGSVVRG